MRLKNIYQFLYQEKLIKEDYESLFVSRGKQGLQKYVIDVLKQSYSSIELDWFDAMRNFLLLQRSQLFSKQSKQT